MEMTIQECVDALIRVLEAGGILTGGPADPTGLPMPDGDEIIDLHVAPRLVMVVVVCCWQSRGQSRVVGSPVGSLFFVVVGGDDDVILVRVVVMM